MIKKIINFFINNIYQFILLLVIIIFFMVNFYDLRYKISLNSNLNKYYIIFILLSLILSVIVFILSKKMNNFNDKKIPKIFVLSAIILGAIYLSLAPLFTGSDEHNHFYRIYEITDGVIITPSNKVVGSKMPLSLSTTFINGSGNNTKIKYDNLKEMWDVKLNISDKGQYGNLWTTAYNNTALYSPVQYLPQVIGFLIAKTFGFRPYLIGIFGRVSNLVFYVLIGYFCLKFVPKSRIFYLLILLSPNMLQCATTLSADAFTNVIFLLLISLIFKICYSKNKIDKREKFLLLILCVIISLCKIVYLPIVFLILLINSNSFKNGNKEKVIFSIITILVSVFVSFLWMGCTSGVFEIAYDQTEFQKHFILNNLLNYFIVLVRTFSQYIIKYIECLFVGTTMYHSQLRMPALISFLYVILIILSLLKNSNKINFNISKRIFIGIVSIIIVGLISTAIYVQCTAQYYSIGNPTIEGIQGRYFIPIIMLIPFIFQLKNIKFKKYNLYIGTLSVNLITWFYMINQFIN